MNKENQERRWEEWRQTDFDELLRVYTRVVNDFALSNFIQKDMEDVKELAMDSSFILDQLWERYYYQQENRLRPSL